MERLDQPQVVVLIGLDSTVAPQILAALHRQGYGVELANSGPDALARFRETPPSLFILNELLTNIDELEFFAGLHSEPALEAVPFITLVKGDDKARLTPQEEPNLAGILEAPFSDGELLEAVDGAIRSGRIQTRDFATGVAADVAMLSRLTPPEELLADIEKGLAEARQSKALGFGLVAAIRLEELARLAGGEDAEHKRDMVAQVAEQVAELAAYDATAFEEIGLDSRGNVLLYLPELRVKHGRARLRSLAQRIAQHRFQVGNQATELTSSIGFAQLSGAAGLEELQDQLEAALDQAASHQDLEPVLHTADKAAAHGHALNLKAPGWFQSLLNRHRLSIQFVLTLIVGIVLPYWFYRGMDAIGFDISGPMYVAIVIILSLTVLFIWWECFLALKQIDPPQNPGRPYPPASAVIAAYLPNEAEVLESTIEAFLGQRYPNQLHIILAYNTPKDMPFEETLKEISRRDPRFVPLRVIGSTSKAQNVNVALARVRGEFVGVFDADHQPDPDSFRRAWRWLSNGADVVQGHCFIRNGDASLAARMVAVEFEQIYAVSHPGRARLHGFGIFGGSNGYWKTSLIRQMRMQGFMLTEDIDSSMRAVIRGRTIVSDPKLISRELAPETWAALLKQRLRWAQGWLQISMKWIIPSLRSPYLNWRQKLGMFHLLVWREAYAWISLQVFPIVAFWAHKAGGLANLDWFRPIFLFLTLTTLATGPGQVIFTYLLAEPEIRKRGRWFVEYVVVSTFFYSEFKNFIARIAHLKEAMKEKAWVVTARSVKPKP